MKKTAVCILMVFTMIIALPGCAGDYGKEQGTSDNAAIGVIEGVEIPSSEEKRKEEELPPLPAEEVSNKSAVIYYAGEDFAKSIFAVGGTMLYVYGSKADGSTFLGSMRKEDDIFREFTVPMDAGMRAFNMAVDEQGRCHILWMSVERFEEGGQQLDRITYEKSCITVVDDEGRVEKEIDVTDLFSAGYRRPFCFVADREGNYYFENEREIVQIRNDGTKGTVFVCDGGVEGIGMGKSGDIYCAYLQENGDRRLGRLGEDGIHPWELLLPEAAAIYAGIYAGTDSELLLFNKESGVFACDEKNIEARVSGKDLPIRGQSIAGYGMLLDGRMCVMGKENEKTVFHYVPAGK